MLVTIAKYSLLEAVRDKFFIFIIAGLLVIVGLSLFASELAITESVQMKVAFLGSGFRLFTIFTISLFVITSMVRELNDKGFELILSHPVPRWAYYVGKLAGFVIISMVVVLLITFCLLLYVPVQSLVFWSLSLLCETSIIIALSLLTLYSFNSITISFSVVAGFYLLSRTSEALLLISSSPILTTTSVSHKFITWLIELISYLLPGLYKFTQTEWLIYSPPSFNEFGIVFGQTIIYVVFLSGIALYDLYRKEL